MVAEDLRGEQELVVQLHLGGLDLPDYYRVGVLDLVELRREHQLLDQIFEPLQLG
jgi:hypothetical protein